MIKNFFMQTLFNSDFAYLFVYFSFYYHLTRAAKYVGTNTKQWIPLETNVYLHLPNMVPGGLLRCSKCLLRALNYSVST